MSELLICAIFIISSKSTRIIHERDQLTFNHPHYNKCKSMYKSTNKASVFGFIHSWQIRKYRNLKSHNTTHKLTQAQSFIPRSHPSIEHFSRQIVSKCNPRSTRLNVPDQFSIVILLPFIVHLFLKLRFNRVNGQLRPYEIVQKTTCSNDSTLSFDGVVRCVLQYSLSSFQDAETSLNTISCLRVFHVEKFLRGCRLVTLSPFTQMISLSSIRGQKPFPVSISNIAQIVLP